MKPCKKRSANWPRPKTAALADAVREFPRLVDRRPQSQQVQRSAEAADASLLHGPRKPIHQT